MSKIYKSVWDALENDLIVRDNLKARSMLLEEISAAIENLGEMQKVIAEQLNITQPRVSALMKGKIHKFSVDNLMALAYKLGLDVTIKVHEPNNEVAA